MAGKKPQGTSDADWLLGAWQMAGEMGTDLGLGVAVQLTPTRRKGVWRVRCRLLHLVDGRPTGCVVQTDAEYPNAAAQSFTAFLGQQMHELDKLLLEEINAQRLTPP